MTADGNAGRVSHSHFNGSADRCFSICNKLLHKCIIRFPAFYPNDRESSIHQNCVSLGDIYKGMGEDSKALDAYRRGLGAMKDSPEIAAAYQAEIYNLQMKLGVAGQAQEVVGEYVVQERETLSSIAKDFMTKVELIKLANNKLDNEIKAGQTLYISWVNPEILVDKRTYELVLSWKGEVVSKFKVGIGKDGATPAGEFNRA